jgi:hypothetical protein
MKQKNDFYYLKKEIQKITKIYQELPYELKRAIAHCLAKHSYVEKWESVPERYRELSDKLIAEGYLFGQTLKMAGR